MKIRFFIFFLILFLSISTSAADFLVIESVPFFPSNDYQCGPASLASVLMYLGLGISPQEISKEIFSVGARGTADFDMILYPIKRGFKSLHYRGSLEDIKEKIKEGKPLIVMTDEGFWFYKKYHYMVVLGFDSSNVIVNSGEERFKRISYEDFNKKWKKTDFWTLLIEK